MRARVLSDINIKIILDFSNKSVIIVSASKKGEWGNPLTFVLEVEYGRCSRKGFCSR